VVCSLAAWFCLFWWAGFAFYVRDCPFWAAFSSPGLLLLMMLGGYGALISLVLELLDPDNFGSCCFSSLLSGFNLPSPFVFDVATASSASFSRACHCCYSALALWCCCSTAFLGLCLGSLSPPLFLRVFCSYVFYLPFVYMSECFVDSHSIHTCYRVSVMSPMP